MALLIVAEVLENEVAVPDAIDSQGTDPSEVPVDLCCVAANCALIGWVLPVRIGRNLPDALLSFVDPLLLDDFLVDSLHNMQQQAIGKHLLQEVAAPSLPVGCQLLVQQPI